MLAGLLPALALATSTQVEYDAAGRVSAEIDANGNRTSYGYDKTGRKISETNSLGETRRTEYDALGNIVAVTSPSGIVTRYIVDELNRRTRIDYVDGHFLTRTYDALGHKLSETDENGHTTFWAYDALGHLEKVTDAAGYVTSFTYDEAGNRISQTLANGKTTRWAYDANHQLISETLPLGQRRSLAYTAAGQLGSETDFRGQTTLYSYDALGQVLRRQTATGSISYAYERGLIKNVTEPRGTTVNSYDADGRLLNRQDPDGVSVSYGYDNIGRREQVGSAQGVTHYAFDALGRLASVTDPQGQVTQYTYDNEGRKAKEVLPNGIVTTYAYWPRGWVKTITHQQGEQGPVLARYAYDYDAKGRRTAATEDEEGVARQRQFAYDDLDRLTQETLGYTDAQGHQHEIARQYTYDPVSNRTQQTLTEQQDGTVLRHAVTAYAYDDNSRLTSEQTQDLLTSAVTLRQTAYDANGSPVSVTENGTATTLAYDAENRLGAITGPGIAASYQYDAEGNRIAKTVNGQRTRFVLDTSQDYVQVLEAVDNLGNQRRVTYGLGPVAERNNGLTQWVLKDAQQSSRVLVDTTGQPAAHLYYSAFGESEAGTAAGVSLLHRYDGEQVDEETGNYYLRARYMSPSLGRFTQKDSWDGDLNRPVTLNQYLFAEGNPINRWDPSGHEATVYEEMEVSEAIGADTANAINALALLTFYSALQSQQSGSGIGSPPSEIWTLIAGSALSSRIDYDEAARLMAAARDRYRDRDVNHGHHTIPKYLCGHAEQGVLPSINAKEHAIIHTGLAAVRVGVDAAGRFADTMLPIGRKKKEAAPVRALAATPLGRAFVGQVIGNFYRFFGFNGIGTPTIGEAFPEQYRRFYLLGHMDSSCEGTFPE